MSDTTLYNYEVSPGTRNHKGYFVQDAMYKLMGVDQAGWAYICIDDMSCCYVDPDNLVTVLSTVKL